METLPQFIETYGLWVVFVCVLFDQGGLPTPAYPPIILTASLAAGRHESLAAILLVAVLAATLADLTWYLFGRRYGATMLRTICKVSLTPDSCVGMTRKVFDQWGAKTLIVAKFIPGLAAISTTLAGESRTNLARFIIFDSLGAALWAGAAIALGVILDDAVEAVLTNLGQYAGYALLLFAVALALFIAIKWRARRRFLAKIRMSRLSPQELTALIREGKGVTILDVRSAGSRVRAGWIPGSIHVMDIESLRLGATSEVVVYCECPNDASAAIAARRLIEKGFPKVRPLAGGFDAWKRNGGEVAREEPLTASTFARASETESPPAWYA
jgi:membrane protein DedA with SNARE-associated domain/rhodanese-related sulfurtransferase